MSSSQKGFTLAEVLIALALLGVVAAFTIPKVLQASNGADNIAKVKEVAGTLESSWYNKKLQGTLTTGANIKLWDNLTDLNTIASARTTADALLGGAAHLCGSTGTYKLANLGYVQFANGVVVTGLVDNAATTAGDIKTPLSGQKFNYLVCVDTNGASAPNTLGSDVYLLNFNPSGQFDTTNYVASDTGKNFSYAVSTTNLYTAGAPAAAATNILAAGAAGTAGLPLQQ